MAPPAERWHCGLPLMQRPNALSQNQGANATQLWANALRRSAAGHPAGHMAQAQRAQGTIGQMAAQLNQANFPPAPATPCGLVITGRDCGPSPSGFAQAELGDLNLQAASSMAGPGDLGAQANAVKNTTIQQMAGAAAGRGRKGSESKADRQVPERRQLSLQPAAFRRSRRARSGMTPYEQSGSGFLSTGDAAGNANPLCGSDEAALEDPGRTLFPGGFPVQVSGGAPCGRRALAPAPVGDSRPNISRVGSKMGIPDAPTATKAFRACRKVVGPMAPGLAKNLGPGSVAKIPGSAFR